MATGPAQHHWLQPAARATRADAQRGPRVVIKLPEIMLSGLIFLAIITLHLPQDEFPSKWNYVGLLLAGIAFFALRYVIDAKRWGVELFVAGTLIAWIGYVFLHGMWHPPGTEYAYNKYPYFVLVASFGLILLPTAIRAHNGWRALILALIAAGLFMSMVSFFPSLTGAGNGRRSILGLNPVMLAKIASVPIIVAIAFRNLSTFWKSFLWPIAMLSVAACVNSGSRTPLLAIAIAYFLALLRKAKVRELFRSAGIYVLLAGIFFLYLSIANPEVAERFSLEMLSREGEMRPGDRLFLQNLAIDVSRENPMGIGFGNFSTLFWVPAPHNIYLEALVELGWLGLVPLLLLTWLGLSASLRLLKDPDPTGQFFGIFFLYALITSLVGNELSLPALLFYISLGCAVSYDRTRAEDPTVRMRARAKGKRWARHHAPAPAF